MDYSASIHDDTNPTGQSVWGSSSPAPSPQRNRLGFTAATAAAASSSLGSDPADSPFQASYDRLQQHNPSGDDGEPGDYGFRRPDTVSSSTGASEPGTEDSSAADADADAAAPPSPPQPSSRPLGEGAAGASAHVAGVEDEERLAPEERGPPLPPSRSSNQGNQLPSPPLPPPPAGHQTGQQAQWRRSETAQPQQPQQQPQQYKLQAKVTGLERTGKKDPILRFDVHTNLPRFRTTQYRDVRRLHSEFVKLAEHLISANPDAMVHAVPPPLTSAGAGTEEDEVRVKALIQRWLNYTCGNETLMRDDEMVLFVESDFGYSPMVKMKQPATGVRRKILKQFAPPPDDTPELQEARPTVKLFYLGSMDAGHKVDKLVKSRRGLALAEGEFGVRLGAMHVQEPHLGLANAYKKLGKVLQAVGDSHAAQATAEATTLGDPLQYHSSDAFVVKETLTNRQILIRELLQAQETTRSRLNAADRLKATSNVRRDRVDEAIAAHREAQQVEAQLQARTGRVTHSLVRERRRWFAQTALDLRLGVREFVIREIEAERRALSMLESVRPDIRSIDASGGLSRLGRESHPHPPLPSAPGPGRRTSLAASQGPRGDAWSGVPRRSDARSASMVSSILGGGGGAGPETEGEGGGGSGRADSEAGPDAAGTGRASVGGSGLAGLAGLKEEDDEDRIDAKNAASRLATTTF